MGKDRKTDLITRFTQGLTSESENRELRALLGSTEDKEFDLVCRRFWNERAGMSEERKSRMKAEMARRITEYEDSRRKIRTGIWKKLAVAGAVAASLFIAAFAGFHAAGLQLETQEYRVACAEGERSRLTLPDGTTVQLNSASSLTYTSAYNGRRRDVELSGEAFFDVAHDENRPFTVTAGGMQVKVLGTRFNVKAYGDEEVETTLVEGSIQALAGGHEVMLEPNERLAYDKMSGKLVKTTGLSKEKTAPWVDGELDFNHSTLDEIATVLERMYGISISFGHPDIAGYSFTGHIKDNSLDNVLELVASTSGLEYHREGRNVILRKKK